MVAFIFIMTRARSFMAGWRSEAKLLRLVAGSAKVARHSSSQPPSCRYLRSGSHDGDDLLARLISPWGVLCMDWWGQFGIGSGSCHDLRGAPDRQRMGSPTSDPEAPAAVDSLLILHL